jgi:cobalt/nickel transport system permease protein
MHIHFLDPYRPVDSPVHALDPRVKLVLALAYILTAALTPVGAWPVYVLLLAVIFSVEILSALGIGFVHRRALLALPFMLAAVPVIFTSGETALFSLPIGAWTLTGYGEGLARFVSVALKSWLSVQAAIVLATSTPFPDLLQAMRAVRVPRLLVAMFGLMWRYLFVLVDEALRLMRARAARSGQVEGSRRAGGSVAWRARMAGGMAGNLFLRAFERSDRIYMAMMARGYDGEIRALPMAAVGSGSWLALGAGLLLLLLLLLFGFLFWG